MPNVLKKQLEAIHDLQSQIYTVEKCISAVENDVPNSPNLADMRTSHAMLTASADHLYDQLNVAEGFPELMGHTQAFARLLLKAHECKKQVQRLATAHLQEVETIDQAVQGRRNPLGGYVCATVRYLILLRHQNASKGAAFHCQTAARLDTRN